MKLCDSPECLIGRSKQKLSVSFSSEEDFRKQVEFIQFFSPYVVSPISDIKFFFHLCWVS